MSELREHRIKRLKMRSMRRGIKEMDLILQRFAEAELDSMQDDDLTIYDAMLSENDHDLYQWVTGQMSPPPKYEMMMKEIIASLPQIKV